MADRNHIRILNARNALIREHAEKKRRYDEAFAGASSASVSSGSGSKSYNNWQLSEMRAELDRIERQISSLNRRLGGASLIRHVVTVRG